MLLLFKESSASSSDVKFILLYEAEYLKVVCKSVNPGLTDENFEIWPAGTSLLTLLDSVSKHYGKLEPCDRPIVVLPTEAWFFSVYYGDIYPDINFIQPYKYGDNMPNLFNYNFPIPKNVCLVSSGNKSSDWTWGNGYTFLDTSNIQFIREGLVLFRYKVTHILDNRNRTTSIFNPDIVGHVKVGWLIYTHFFDENDMEVTVRSQITAINLNEGYITINRAPAELGEFYYGKLSVYYLSPVTAVVATKIKMIMDTTGYGFSEVIDVAKQTTANKGVRTDSTGYGLLDVEKTINKITYSDAATHSTSLEINSYPNPFNPTTTISFSVPSNQLVSLRVYDILGREIKTLINNEMLSAGKKGVTFDASSLPSGTYFYKICVGNITEIKKMMLIK